MTGGVVYMLEGSGFDDEVINLSIPFTAGQVFKLAFADVGGGLGAEFEPIEIPNGSRLQSLTVASVPEPNAFCLLLVGMLLFVAAKVPRQ